MQGVSASSSWSARHPSITIAMNRRHRAAPLPGDQVRRGQGRRGRPGEKPLVHQGGHRSENQHEYLDSNDHFPSGTVDHQLKRQHQEQGLGDLLLEIAAGRVWVLQHQAPETGEVGPPGPDPQVIVDRPPQEHGEPQVEPQDRGDGSPPPANPSG